VIAFLYFYLPDRQHLMLVGRPINSTTSKQSI